MIPVGILTASQPSTGGLLLDLYPNASAAYSFRKLNTAYTGNCIRVMSSAVGNPFADIGFISNVLDTAALLAFIGSNTGRVITWYDQSGNGNNATQSTFANACIIVDSGSLVTDGGKVAIIGNQFLTLNFAIVTNTSYAGFSVMSRTSTAHLNTSFTGSVYPIISLIFTNGSVYNYNKVTEIRYGYALTGRHLFSTLNAVNVQNAYLDGTIQTVITSSVIGTGNIDRLLGRSTSEAFVGKTQEHIFYNIDETLNVTGINTNINTYYTIF